MIIIKKSSCILTLLTILAICSGCGGGGGGSSSVTLDSIAITANSNNIPAGQTLQLAATGTYSNSSTQNLTNKVIWSVSDETYATVSVAGLISSTRKGAVSVTATYNGKSGTFSIEVTDPVLIRLDLLIPVTSIPTGPQLQIQTKGVYSNGTISDVTEEAIYTLSDDNNASISDSGLLSDVTGDVTITACLNSVCKDLVIQHNTANLVSISVSATSDISSVGFILEFKAIGSYDDGSIIDISNTATWTSSLAAIALPINESYQFTLLSIGIFTATASFGDGPVVTGTSLDIEVDNNTLISITIEPQPGEYPRGYFTGFRAIGDFSGDHKDITHIVTWSLDDDTIGAFPNSTGNPGFFITGAAGSAIVTAAYNGIETSETITVTDVTFLGFDIKPDTSANYIPILIDINSNPITLQIYGLYSDEIARDLSSVCRWQTPVNDILLIDGNGEVSAQSLGDWGVIAVIGGLFGVVQPVSVIKEITSFSISVTHSTIPTHADIIFSAEATYQDLSTDDITNYVLWDSDATDKVRFFDDVRYYAHGVSVGTSNINASLLVNGSTIISSSNNLQVTVQPLDTMRLFPYDSDGDPTSALSTTVGFIAVGQYTGNNVDHFTITNYVTWSSSNENFISISNESGSKGVITVNSSASESATISAVVGDGSGSNNISTSFGPIQP